MEPTDPTGWSFVATPQFRATLSGGESVELHKELQVDAFAAGEGKTGGGSR